MDLGPQPGEAAWPTLEDLARLPALSSEYRFRAQELAQILHWGTGFTNVGTPESPPEAILSISSLTRTHLVASGITLEEAEQWAYAYAVEAAQFPNPSAYPRSQLLWCVVKLLRDPNEQSTGTDCCADELGYHPLDEPPIPPRGWRARS